MKTLLITILVSLNAASGAFAAQTPQRAASSSYDFAPFVLDLKPDSTSSEVRRRLGSPHATLGADLWIYWNFGDPNPNAGNPAYDTLVIAFASSRVMAVKITDGRVVRRLLAEAARHVRPARPDAVVTK